MYKLPVYYTIIKRIKEPRKFIQVIMGPRQVGKSTVIKQVVEDLDINYQIFFADNVPVSDSSWIARCWETVRTLYNQSKKEILLIIDEIQKIENWSEIVKKLWDEDSFYNRNIKVVLLGSSRVLLEKGLSDSLAGRFEEIRMTHWSYLEMKQAFGLSLDEYIYYGGYPGAASLISDPERFNQYIGASIIDATINKDILQNTQINKPALLRQTFELAAAYSGKILSYTKMLGHLQDAGNTTTLAQYLHLLDEACLVTGLMKYTGDFSRSKRSIPKFQVYNNALTTFYSSYSLDKILTIPSKWGNVYESAIGSYILSQAFKHRFEVFYWREGDKEVDFILKKKDSIVALEIKSNNVYFSKGLEEFKSLFHPKLALVVGEGGMKTEDFLCIDVNTFF